MGQGRVRHIVLGEVEVSDAPDLAVCTTVGSCVAACLFDPQRGVGGMNHFLLPDGPAGMAAGDDGARRYGVHLMELLINGLLQRGASRAAIQAKVFGGASLTSGLTDAGARNGAFIQTFLRHEGIALVAQSLGGQLGRRVQFWPATGRARQMFCRPVEPPSAADLARLGPARGDVELF